MSKDYRASVDAEISAIDAPLSSATFAAVMQAIAAADKLDRGEGDEETVNSMHDALVDIRLSAHQE